MPPIFWIIVLWGAGIYLCYRFLAFLLDYGYWAAYTEIHEIVIKGKAVPKPMLLRYAGRDKKSILALQNIVRFTTTPVRKECIEFYDKAMMTEGEEGEDKKNETGKTV